MLPPLKEEDIKALLQLTSIPYLHIYEIQNRYWPRNEHYAIEILRNPWRLIQTKYGNLIIGKRKRVYVIDWSGTSYRGELECPPEEKWITCTDTEQHCYTKEKFLEKLNQLLEKININSF